jgi:hypothetical protein
LLFYVKLQSETSPRELASIEDASSLLNLAKLLEKMCERARDLDIGGAVEVCKFKSVEFVSMKKFLIIIDRHFPRTMIIGFS